jgi:hypothetical protein
MSSSQRGSVPVDEGRQRAAVVALVEHVAADDEVKAALHTRRAVRRCHGVRAPVAMAVAHRRQLVQPQVLQQEGTGQRVDVAGRDLGAAAVADQAGQGQAAADLQDALAVDQGADRHRGGQVQPGGPDLAEQRPLRARDAQGLGRTGGVGELLAVQQRADLQIRRAIDGERLNVDFIAGHLPSGVTCVRAQCDTGRSAPLCIHSGRATGLRGKTGRPRVARGLAPV